MSQPAIEVSGLSKRYVIQHESRHDNLRDTLHHSARKLWRRLRWGTGFETEEFYALRDVSFSIQPGEVVGIIGRNGAGKSTLLKVLSRITEPTTGRITLRGRVASLLEVGTGFHPDLTGRENVFLNGAILGMSRAEIRAKFDEIVAFAEVERFLDTPVKRYSSGMYVRLAFAVAAHLEPEILIVDEVLAVGDAQFQKKCLGKMHDVAAGQGRTVLFVSHNPSAIRALCSTALLLDAGRVAARGPAAEILATYTRAGAAPATAYHRTAPAPDARPCILSARICTSSGADTHETDAPLVLDVELEPAACAAPVVGLHLYDSDHRLVLQTSSQFAPRPAPDAPPVRRWTITLPPHALNVGDYRCTLVLGEQDVAIHEQLDHILAFTVADTAFPAPGSPSAWAGTPSPKLAEWRALP